MASSFKEQLQQYKPGDRPVKIRIKHVHPHRVERAYSDAMRDILRAIHGEIKESVVPAIKAELALRNEKNARTDSLADIMRLIRSIMRRIIPGQDLADQIANRTYRANERAVTESITRSLGVAIPLPGGDRSMIDAWIVDNTSVIEDLQSTYLNRIQRAISDGFVRGSSYREIAREIQKQTDIAWRRAKNIARDQVGTLNGLVTKQRDEELGVESFIWRTMRDARVRGNPSGLYPKSRPSHYAREGKTYTWADGASGEFPGTPINCRCYAEAVIEI